MEIASCALVLVLSSLEATSQQIIYDLNSQTPDQVLDEVVKTGAAPDHVSRILFGTPTVVTAFSALDDQPLLFSSVDQEPSQWGFYYNQIELSMRGLHPPSLDLSFDFVDVGQDHYLTVFFDTPYIIPFVFSEGQIYFAIPYVPSVPIGSYQMETAQHFGIRIDYDLNRWVFTQNQAFLAQGILNATNDELIDIRFNYTAAGSGITGTAIDNVVVAIVPEPAGLFLCGLLALGLIRLLKIPLT